MTLIKREDGRKHNELRPIKITRNYLKHPDGSVLVECGNTKVIVTATIETNAPFFQKEKGEGWLTAEYGMLPASTNTRMKRERASVGGRTMEIQRLIGRSLRMAVNLKDMEERTITLDADVIQADGGTRTAAITGAWVALYDAVQNGLKTKKLEKNPIKQQVAAISVGVIKGQPMLDLCYTEDSRADVDMNIVMTANNQLIEIQGTGENAPFSKEILDELYSLASNGLSEIFKIQRGEK
ncbi:MAG: ribonuclease PH [Candidatus Margulisbacteria bacterium]|nr:ribonuclease PH [Candidatus Margulisiibacteriota bacterium]